jgi:hypothetical protein
MEPIPVGPEARAAATVSLVAEAEDRLKPPLAGRGVLRVVAVDPTPLEPLIFIILPIV